MPAIQPGDKVLVSGANGFIAVWVLQTLLEKGYSVRGTVRSAAKAAHLDSLFKAKYAGKWEWVVVADITQEDAFDEAVKSVDGILHMASPFNYEITSPEAAIQPAVQGTVGILKSATKFGPQIKRIVITSSIAAILEIGDMSVPRTFTEEDWNNQAPALVEAHGAGAGPLVIYCASKMLAEKAAWDYLKDNKGRIAWDLTTVNPSFVLGPILHEVKSAEALNQSALDWYRAVLTPDSSDEKLAREPSNSYVDVRDVATAHVLALETEAAGGERFLISRSFYVYQDWLDVIQNILPSIQGTLPANISASRLAALPKGVRGAGKAAVRSIEFDVRKADKVLGIKYRSVEETAEDSLKDYLGRGW
ncbi:D-lactaldehyde dehydrogenase [Mycena rosella]|uniref:D-lactaldehyde dehydrogenase n=1 Tax=Mycena rosella TaxID=1033263 RepID=A0AAD7D763_MYCRO|nr:D-lactaldehyde dehydrogenase [Mycena rosella]